MFDNINFTGPLEKLIDSVQRGAGALFSSYLIKKNAEATAYEINLLKESLSDTSAEITIMRNGTTINLKNENSFLNFILDKELNKIENTLKLIQDTAKFLEGKEKVSNEKVDSDWLNRFFQITENITDNEIRILWAKILADEIEKPNSYTLRTLELLKNLSKREAMLFTKFVKIAVTIGDNKKLRVFQSNKYYSQFKLCEADLELLEELNLIRNDKFFTIGKNQIIKINYGNEGVLIKNKESDIIFATYSLTTIGIELSFLIDRIFDPIYIENIKNYFNDLI